MFFGLIPSEENRSMEQQGTVHNRTFVLLNFRSIILEPTIHIYIYIFFFFYRKKFRSQTSDNMDS